jgi:hypothetical protein
LLTLGGDPRDKGNDSLHLAADTGGSGGTRSGGSVTTPNFGAQAFLSLWKPTVPADPPALESRSHVTVLGGDQQIEAGYLVGSGKDPELYVGVSTGANQPQALNIASGFIQTNNNVVLGGPLGPVSVSGGTQHGFKVSWLRDPQGNWWLGVSGVDSSDNPTAVGYYPNFLFAGGGLASGGDQVFFGGRLTGPRLKRGAAGVGVKFQMGSGDLPNAGANSAASQTNCIVFTDSQATFSVPTLKGVQDDRTFYPVDLHNNTGLPFDTFFFFGGDGTSFQ